MKIVMVKRNPAYDLASVLPEMQAKYAGTMKSTDLPQSINLDDLKNSNFYLSTLFSEWKKAPENNPNED